MTSVVCFKDVKQAALYFDKILPVSFRSMQGTGTDIVFEFPEKIPSRAMVDIVFDDSAINYSEKQRYNAIGQVIDQWDVFRKKTSDYWSPSSESSKDENYDDLSTAYLENRYHQTLGPIRTHFQEYARSLGLKSSDILLPTEVGNNETGPFEAILSLTNLELIDVGQASWEQIVELRNDIDSRKKLQRLRVFLSSNYSNKSASYIEDDISKGLEDYNIARKKHGFDTIVSSLSIILDSKNIQSVAAAGIGAAFFGGPMVGISSVAALELGKFAIEFSKRRKSMIDWQAAHDLAYLVDIISKFGECSNAAIQRTSR
ncbi:hypothetical protein [Sedimenticola thiotaurini]|uniref:Uncharacterized protein n=1 Tax=Sedimenticola thiotaurini TaxID=1543721 RepID=A0A0F7JZU7_9GAMM|nr:hypothetical protein [Sedimenticola thiotaurini]AKH21866.1 hypothetical protein AAY24_17680 [Sedimenticola thiotaurini]